MKKIKYYKNIVYIPYDMTLEEALGRYEVLLNINVPEAKDDLQKIIEYFIFNTYPFRACFRKKMEFNSFEERLRKFYYVLHYLSKHNFEPKKTSRLLKPLAFVSLREEGDEEVKHIRMHPEEYRKYILERAKNQENNYLIMRKVSKYLKVV